MNKVDITEKQRFIFGKLFLLSNKLQVIGDKALAGEMTISQWLLTVAIVKFRDIPPTLSEVAELTGSSHQNVKQLALKLQKSDFLSIEKDRQDQRAIRLILTEKISSLCKGKHEKIEKFLIELFKDFSEDEIDSLYDSLNKLYDSIVKDEKH